MRKPAVVIGFFLFACLGFAQSDRGTITGTVSDPAGAVIASTPIQARNVETGLTYQGATSATGNYTLRSYPPVITRFLSPLRVSRNIRAPA